MKKLVLFAAALLVLSQAGLAAEARLTWTAPTTNTDGTPYDDLTSYDILYGCQQSGQYENLEVLQSPIATEYIVTGLPSTGTCYFALRSYNSLGVASDLSNEAQKSMAALPGSINNLVVTWKETQEPIVAITQVTTGVDRQSDTDEVSTTINGTSAGDIVVVHTQAFNTGNPELVVSNSPTITSLLDNDTNYSEEVDLDHFTRNTANHTLSMTGESYSSILGIALSNAAVLGHTTLDCNGGNASASRTAPTNTAAAVAFITWYDIDNGTDPVSTVTIGGQSGTPFTNQATNDSLLLLGTFGVLITGLSAGSQTVALNWTNNAAVDEGGILYVVWLQDTSGGGGSTFKGLTLLGVGN